MGGGLRNLRGKTERNPFDPVNREKRIHENPSHFNLIPDFLGSISKNRVFQRELYNPVFFFDTQYSGSPFAYPRAM